MDINYYKKYEPIDGKWYIKSELGSGAFGKVFEIERRDFTNDTSALKIITIPASPAEVQNYREENYDLDEKSVTSYFYGFVEEFIREFALMTKLKGQNHVVRIEDYDVKEHEGEIGWDIFIRMELLTPMNKHFAQNAPKTRDVIKLGIDICKALEVCQKFNIVHRDIKPSNIFISDSGDYKLGDFGVARTLEKTSSGLSKKGTYTYMAPEVFKGEAYGSNVDIYSLGIVMYKLLNNNMEPYKQGRTHEDDEKALTARLKGEPMPKPTNAVGRLAEIILKACAFDPKDRYESPARMREELESIFCSEREEKIIFPKGNELEFEASTNGSTSSTPEPKKQTELEDEKTVGIFDLSSQAMQDNDEKTAGIFDKKPDTISKKTPESSEKIEKKIISYEGGSISVDEEHKGIQTARRVVQNLMVDKNTSKDETPVRFFKDIDSYDDELKKVRENETIKISGTNKKRVLGILIATILLLGMIIAIAVGTTAPNKETKDVATGVNPKIVSISTGFYHTVGLKDDGTVVAVGDNKYGQCNIENWTDIVSISTGHYHTVGLKKDGTVVAAGDKGSGQCNVENWTDIKFISAVGYQTIGLKHDGTVVAVGNNDYGQCNTQNWSDIISVYAEYMQTTGLKSDGTIVVAGENDWGQQNINDWRNIVEVCGGNGQTVGLREDGTVVAIGWNDYGQCNTQGWSNIISIYMDNARTLGLRADGTVVATGANLDTSGNVKNWTDIRKIYTSDMTTIGLKNDGTVIAAGHNGNGECDVQSWTNITDISLGRDHTVGLKDDGTVVATGDNRYGQCDVNDWSIGYTGE